MNRSSSNSTSSLDSKLLDLQCKLLRKRYGPLAARFISLIATAPVSKKQLSLLRPLLALLSRISDGSLWLQQKMARVAKTFLPKSVGGFLFQVLLFVICLLAILWLRILN